MKDIKSNVWFTGIQKNQGSHTMWTSIARFTLQRMAKLGFLQHKNQQDNQNMKLQ